jgi:hypothetical protein
LTLTLVIAFLDLRELDAVLSQSLSGITKRIEELTQRIEGGLASLSTLSAIAKGQAGKGDGQPSYSGHFKSNSG